MTFCLVLFVVWYDVMLLGDSGVLRALKRLLLKRRAGLESHLRDVAHEAVQLGATTTCRKVSRYFAKSSRRGGGGGGCVPFFFCASCQWSHVPPYTQNAAPAAHHTLDVDEMMCLYTNRKPRSTVLVSC